jgi:hypothetical protein
MEILYPYPRWEKINLAAMRLSGTSPFRGAAYLAAQSFASIRMDNKKLVTLLVAIVKTSKEGTHAS